MAVHTTLPLLPFSIPCTNRKKVDFPVYGGLFCYLHIANPAHVSVHRKVSSGSSLVFPQLFHAQNTPKRCSRGSLTPQSRDRGGGVEEMAESTLDADQSLFWHVWKICYYKQKLCWHSVPVPPHCSQATITAPQCLPVHEPVAQASVLMQKWAGQGMWQELDPKPLQPGNSPRPRVSSKKVMPAKNGIAHRHPCKPKMQVTPPAWPHFRGPEQHKMLPLDTLKHQHCVHAVVQAMASKHHDIYHAMGRDPRKVFWENCWGWEECLYLTQQVVSSVLCPLPPPFSGSQGSIVVWVVWQLPYFTQWISLTANP